MHLYFKSVMPPHRSDISAVCPRLIHFPGRFTLFKIAIIQTVHSILGFVGELSKKKISVYASSTAYFLFSSIPPFIILMSMLLPRFGLSISELVKMVTDITPDDLDYQVTLIIQDAFARSGSVVPIMLVFMIWTAANSIAALSEGLRMAYGVRRQHRYLVFRLLSILYTFSVILLLTAYMLISMFGEKIMGLIGWNRLKLPRFLMMVLNWHNLFFLLVGFTTVLFMYVFLSGRRLSLRYYVFGTIFTVIAWDLFSVIFSAYLKYSTNRSVIYGSFSALVALLLWIYIAICILLAGGVLNKHIHREDDLEEAELRRGRRQVKRKIQAPDGYTENGGPHRHGSGRYPEDGEPHRHTHDGYVEDGGSHRHSHDGYVEDGEPHRHSPGGYTENAGQPVSHHSRHGAAPQPEELQDALQPEGLRNALRLEGLRNALRLEGLRNALRLERLRDTLQPVLVTVRKIPDALAGFWFNVITPYLEKFITNVWNWAAFKKLRSDISRFWNDVVVGRLLIPLTTRLRHFMDRFRHNDYDDHDEV
jgi:membrane protein